MRPQPVAQVAVSESLFEASEVMESSSTAAGSLEMMRVELQCLLKAQHGVGWPRQLFEHAAELAPKRCVIRLELDGLVENFRRFFEMVGAPQSAAERRKI